MINTLNIKQQQLEKGFFTTGSGPEVILIMGSCRVAPYVNYFNRWNEEHFNRLTIHSIDPFNFCWDINDDRVDQLEAIKNMETHEGLLEMLKSVKIFIHEYYQNFGMFNTLMSEGKSIYDFGMLARIDICIPNFNDYFILFGDIVSFDLEMRKKAIADYNVIGKLSAQTEKEIFEIGQKNLEKFYSVCRKSDLPEMEEVFKKNIKDQRFFHSYNHVSKNFTKNVFSLMNEKYLHLDLSEGFWWSIFNEDMFANSFTPLTVYDLEYHGYNWGEGIQPLKDKL